MPVEVFAANEQNEHAVQVDRWSAFAKDVLIACGVRSEAEVALHFVDESSIAALNEEHLGRSGPTDVLAFPIEDDPIATGQAPLLLGDVVICPAVAARNARDHGDDEPDELALLVVHGLLHLLGLDHEEAAEAEQMEAIERDLLDRFHHSLHPIDGPSERRSPET